MVNAKNKILIIFGLLLMIGFVSASGQSYELSVDINRGANNFDVVGPAVEDGYILNPINFNVSVDLDNATCGLSIFGPTSYSNDDLDNYTLEIPFDSGNYSWNITCSNESENFTESRTGSFAVEDVNLSFGGIKDGSFYLNNSIITGNLGFTKNISFLLNGVNLSSFGGSVDFDENTGDFKINISQPGNYILSARSDYFSDVLNASQVNFYVGYISAEFEKNPVAVNENVDVDAYVNLGGMPGQYFYNLTAGEPNSGYSSIASGTTGALHTINGKFKPSRIGTYNIKFNIIINGKSYEINGGSSLTVSTATSLDTTPPSINLIYPEMEQVIADSKITFDYNVSDNVDLAKCRLEIYNATKAALGYEYGPDTLVFPLNSADNKRAEVSPTGKSDEINLKLIDFNEGGYIWQVKCNDSAGNSDSATPSYFYVDLSGNYSATSKPANYVRQSEVQDLIDKINSFLGSEDDFGINEKRAAGLLDMDNKMNLYKKKLLQIDRDLKYNLGFMSEDKRQKRVNEIDNEIDNISQNVVLNISVDDSYEYSKSSPSTSIESIISDYFNATGHEVSRGTLRKLARSNEELQNTLSSRVDAIKLKIQYFNSTKELVVINKKLDIETDSKGTLLEVVPENLSNNISFISDAKSVGNGIWEIDPKQIDENGITYYFYGDVSLQKIEKTESILFSDDVGKESFITGFAIGVGDSFGLGILPIFVGALFMGYVGFVIFGKVKMESWKKEPNVVRILDLMKSTKLLLKENNVVDSRANYVKMSELYKILPNKTKSFFFNEIKMIRLAIDKKDVIGLMKEYEQAKNQGRMQDASEIHSKISAVYKKLPKKFQEKVYQRLIKNELK